MPENVIDPRFFLPPGVIDLSYSDTQDTTSSSGEESILTPTQGITIADPVEWVLPEVEDHPGEFSEVVGDESLFPPDYITVVSQSVKVTSGGAVVDVVIDVQDVPGATQYEVRMTKG